MPANCACLRFKLTCLALSVLLLAGCATGKNPADPFEGFNRGVYEFNEAVDRAILKPVAEGYRFVVPQFVRSSVGNFFSNLNDVVVAVNNVLQGKFKAAYTDLGRVAMNSTIGILGLFDVATEAGIEKHNEDFGQTLGWWGVRDGPFIVLPFFGPSNARDTVGRVGDYFTDVVTYVDPTRSRNVLWGTRTVNRRAELLDASKLLETAALDPYEFVRDAYLQRRRNLVYDGSPPADREFLDAPPKPRSSVPQAVFPTAALESGSYWPTDSDARPASTYAAPVVQQPAALPLAAPAESARDAAERPQPSLTQFWRALQLGAAAKH
jgi:phospholipid-binding lipoprotein MlaA